MSKSQSNLNFLSSCYITHSEEKNKNSNKNNFFINKENNNKFLFISTGKERKQKNQTLRDYGK